MQLRKNRHTECAGLNRAKTLFEQCNCVFQEVALQNDYGKDAYVDLVDGTRVTGLSIAVQIKSGSSYRRASGYAIPINGHANVWRESSLPIAGIVYDPHSDALYWCDISSFLEQHWSSLPGEIPVSKDNFLTEQTFGEVFKPHFRSLARRRKAGIAVLQLACNDPDIREAALLDCFAAGRSDPRVFVILRYLLTMLNDEALRIALHVLAHVTPHPDVFWHKSNWVPENVRAVVRPHLQWSTLEIKIFLSEISWEEWQRGDVGQSLYMLLLEDAAIRDKIDYVARAAIDGGDDQAAWAALYLAVYWAGKQGGQKYRELVSSASELRRLPLVRELEGTLREHGWVTLFE